ncbi:hypothetical protein MHZ92_19970 [Sporosarcina sp. ACRSL]|uniref:hypothetical protein n=1 Tax=Sporosarcina sp. ACRSL TaxID=2918215 RepID=UPI001EF4FDCB|nr:hypothetical protein [Sporosarcina sp. ACRSL]MCG7346386.1 hypothetical protein [Sporosarcina sp. ACRSL]
MKVHEGITTIPAVAGSKCSHTTVYDLRKMKPDLIEAYGLERYVSDKTGKAAAV